MKLFGIRISLPMVLMVVVAYLLVTFHSIHCCEHFDNNVSGSSSPPPLLPSKPMGSIEIDISGNFLPQLMRNKQTALPTQTTAGAADTTTSPTVPTTTSTEGFVGSSLLNDGESSKYSLYQNDETHIDTSAWMAPNLSVTPGQPVNDNVQQFRDRPQQTLPLPAGELDFFANTVFKPDCCTGSSYSSSMGCPCMTSEDVNYLKSRGGNNVPYSEY